MGWMRLEYVSKSKINSRNGFLANLALRPNFLWFLCFSIGRTNPPLLKNPIWTQSVIFFFSVQKCSNTGELSQRKIWKTSTLGFRIFPCDFKFSCFLKSISGLERKKPTLCTLFSIFFYSFFRSSDEVTPVQEGQKRRYQSGFSKNGYSTQSSFFSSPDF